LHNNPAKSLRFPKGNFYEQFEQPRVKLFTPLLLVDTYRGGTSVGRRFNFSEVSALLVDPDHFSTGIIGQILRGFGLNNHLIVDTGEQAKKLLATGRFHLLIIEGKLPDTPATDLVNWVRRNANMNLRIMPIVLLTGYTQFSSVMEARDVGVNSVVRKPVSPKTLFDHIVWAARTDRPFIDADEYIGPDRRFRVGGSATGLSRRKVDQPSDEALSSPLTARR
jgi:CheY-like chemotaxis protein